MTIPSLPPAPALGDSPEVFNTKAFEFVAALDDWGTAANALAVDVNADAASAEADAATATTQAGIATTGANTATTQAGISTTKAGEAAISANLADASSDAANLSAIAAAASAASIDPATLVKLTGDQTIAGVKTFSSNPILSGGTANGVAYLNGSKVLTTGSALVFDGTILKSPTIKFGANATYYGTFTHDESSTGANLYDCVDNGGHVFRVNGGDKLTLNGAGNLGLGVTPSAWNSDNKVLQFPYAGTVAGGTTLDLYCNAYVNSGGTSKYIDSFAYASKYTQYNGVHQWHNTTSTQGAGNTVTWSQAMMLDSSGNLLVGTTSTGVKTNRSMGFQVSGGCAQYISHSTSDGNGDAFMVYGYNGSVIGSITQNGTTGVLYNLTSDYRLKNNPEALTGAKDFVMALQPKKWQWWDGSGEGVGFIAHEFMEVAKYSGNGTKDAVDTEGKPVYQSIQPSSSEVMANLVAHIQDLETRLAALES